MFSISRDGDRFNNNPLIVLDTNVLLMAIKEHWNINSLIEDQISELYQVIVPKFIIEELKNVKEKRTVKIGAQRLAESIFTILDELDYFTPSDYLRKVDDQLVLLATKLQKNNKTIVMTQDLALKDKLLKKEVLVMLVSYGRSKLLR